MNNKITGTIILVLLLAIGAWYITTERKGTLEKGETNLYVTPYEVAGSTEDPHLKMASHYEREEINLTIDLPQYNLPLSTEDISNFQYFNSKIELNEDQKQKLGENGFVVTPYWKKEKDITNAYSALKDRELPIFITSDTTLHLYHIQFDKTLKTLEEDIFYPKILNISEKMMEESQKQYEDSEGRVKEAAKRNTAYYTVGLKLLNPNATTPNLVKEDVEEDLEKIENHNKMEKSTIMHYKEDFTQYKPRGHYTHSEKLKRYFKAMMWYGRISFFLKGCNDPSKCILNKTDADIATTQASLTSISADTVKIGDKTIYDEWDRIYSITSFFVGKADDLTPYEYKNEVIEIFGKNVSGKDLNDDEKLMKLKAELGQLRKPEIFGGQGGEATLVYPPITPEKLDEVLEKTQGMRFMGQRWIPDSYIFQNLVTPAVSSPLKNFEEEKPFTYCLTDLGPMRCFPRGLDVFAVLGSNRALEIMNEAEDTAYKNYSNSMKKLKEEFENYTTEDWNRNLYIAWIHSLKPLIKEYGPGYPTFMQTKAWQDKELNTALSSWAELRHDTILYAKQPYTPITIGVPPQPEKKPGYIEPVPEHYNSLLSLTKMTKNGLKNMDALPEKEEQRLTKLEEVLEKLVELSKKELKNQELAEEDYEYIRNFGNHIENIGGLNGSLTKKEIKTTLVADVHTDLNTKKALEEGTGHIDLITVAYKLPNGEIAVGAGPVMSYYEFKQPMKDRLTDEQWIDKLEKNQAPNKPEFTSNYYQE